MFAQKTFFNKLVLSIVVPLYNEEGNVQYLVEGVEKVLSELGKSYEIILVDDGSHDSTWKEIKKIGYNDPRIKGLSLSRNFGHQHALLAGLHFSSGDAIISMDGDLQHPPEIIKSMFHAWLNGYKIVNTIRIADMSTSLFKKMSSKYFYNIFSMLCGVPISEGSSDFRLIDRQVLESIIDFNDTDLFIRGIINWVGFPATSITYQARKRLSGSTKYNLLKMLKFATGALVSFSTIPLKVGIWVGIITSILSFMELIYVVIQYLQGATVPGWASTIAITSFFFGILFILIGIIGVYIARIHESMKNRPKFLISEKVNFTDVDAYKG